MTDRTHPDSGRATGAAHIIRYALELGLLWIAGDGRDKVREALDALDTLEDQLASIGAGGVSALMGAAKAGSEPVAWAIFAEGGNIRLWSKKPLLHPSAQPLYTHPSPTEGMAGWQPIETAPKDGTPLLLRSKKGRIADGAWITATSSCGGWTWAYVNLEPIEWQPLPVEPSMDGESNG